jgi:hypothetical protein
MIISLADDLAHVTLDAEPPAATLVRSHPALAVLNLYPEDVDKLLSMHERVTEMVGSIA